MEKRISEKKGDVIAPKQFRRAQRAIKNRNFPRRNDGQKKNHDAYMIMKINGSFNSSFLSNTRKRKKLKGWQRENRKYRSVA